MNKHAEALTATVLSKRFVYVLKNRDERPRYYTGVTADVAARLDTHNSGGCPHTSGHRPWDAHVVIEFVDEAHALRFERYLKSGSGRAFAKRHFD
ncbi:MAG TPA: GIY-YIG nuclease family protein [Vicinamibacterales bacterium]|nr:GIY-YIG nuclease family protein [Vicinamibacterales bacterium]